MISLDQTNPNQVSSPGHLDIFIGNPNRHLVVCSGIGMLNLVSDGDTIHDILEIKLPVKATALLTWTAIAGLASILNTDSEYVFGSESVQPRIDGNGTIFLDISIGVQGNTSNLNRISYQTQLLITLDQPVISGTIRWLESDVRAAGSPPRFQVAAGIVTGSGFGNFQGLISGTEDAGSETVKGGVHTVSYSLQVPIALIGTALLMQPLIMPGKLIPVNRSNQSSVVQVKGPDPVTLTLHHLVESDVDFAVTVSAIAR